MLRAANLQMEVRLALLDEADRSKALVFAAEAKARGGAASGSSERLCVSSASTSSSLPPAADAMVVVSLDLAHTLMESALALGKARFVRN